MRAIIGASVRFRLLVVAIAAGIMVVGVLQLRDAPVDVLPEFTPPYVEVQTEALGLSAEEVEQLVTVPLEADLLNGTKGVTVLRSESVPGESSIVLLFEPGTSIFEARQLVQEQLTQAHANPNVSQPPQMLQPLSSQSRVMMIGLEPKGMSPIEASVLARWTIRPRLLGIDGVANVAIFGARDRQLQVLVDPQRLAREHVSLLQVIRTAGNAQLVSPLSFLEASTPGTGGFIDTANQRLSVRHILPVVTPQKLSSVPVDGTGRGGTAMRLGDIAHVVDGHPPLIGDAVVGGGTGLLLVVEKFPGSSTVDVTNRVEEALDDMRPGLTGLQIDSSVFRPADFIHSAVHNLRTAVIVGVALLALVLVALLLAWRTALVCLVAFAVSLTAAALVLLATGATFNALIFAGLAAAVAVVVDDAVLDGEAIRRRLGERGEAGKRGLAPAVVRRAAAEVRGPMGYATVIVLLTTVPVFVMSGVSGAFFEPVVWAYVVAVVASLLVALTVTPALSAFLFPKMPGPGRASPLLRRSRAGYDGALSRIAARPVPVLAGAGVVALAGLAMIPALHGPLIPGFHDRDLLVHFDGPPGTSQPEMSRIVARVARDLRAVPGVQDVGGHLGRAVTGDQIVDVNSSELWVKLDPEADYDGTRAAVVRTVDSYPGFKRSVMTYERQRIRDIGALDDRQAEGNATRSADLDVLTGTGRQPLVVRVYGEDLGVLRAQAERMKTLISKVDGVKHPTVERLGEQPTVAIEVDLARGLRYGIKPGDVRREAATLLQGIQVGSLFEQQAVFEVVVRATPAVRRSVSDIRRLVIDTPRGGHVRLGQIADVRVRPTPQLIQRDASSRRIDVTADVSGRNLGDVQSDVRARLRRTAFPLEYHAQVIGDATGAEATVTRLIVPAIAVALGIFLLLQAAFRSWRLAIVAFAMLPVALVGGELAGLIDGGAFSIGSLLGLLAVLGIAARQAVSLFTHYERMQDRGEAAFGSALVVRGAGDRLAPVVVAAVATVATLVPFLFLRGAAGGEVVQPMAVVVIGGLVTSTLLVLLVGPAAYARFAAAREPAPTTEPDVLERWPGVEAPTNGAREPEPTPGAPTEQSGAVGAGVDKEEGE